MSGMRVVALAVACVCGLVPSLGAMAASPAPKKLLDYHAYSAWRQIRDTQLSRDGRWVAYAEVPAEADGALVLRDLDRQTTYREARGREPEVFRRRAIRRLPDRRAGCGRRSGRKSRPAAGKAAAGRIWYRRVERRQSDDRRTGEVVRTRARRGDRSIFDRTESEPVRLALAGFVRVADSEGDSRAGCAGVTRSARVRVARAGRSRQGRDDIARDPAPRRRRSRARLPTSRRTR